MQKNYRHTTYLSNDTVGFKVKITLNDECKNGHSDFHITGTAYDLTKSKIPSRSNEESSGSIGDKIAAHFPQFAIFEKLHGNDFEGTPMYAIENGFFHMDDKATAMRHLDITSAEYTALQLAKFDEDKEYFHFLIQERLELPTRWKATATEAIAWLEENCDSYSETSHGTPTFKRLPQIKIDLFVQREKEGYYTVENVELRRIARFDEAKQKMLAQIEEKYNTALDKLDNEKMFDVAIAEFFGKEVCAIYYYYTNTFKFNWYGKYNHVTDAEIQAFVESNLKIPQGCTLTK